MTHNLQQAGRTGVSALDPFAVDQVLDALWALCADGDDPLGFLAGDPRLWLGIELKHVEGDGLADGAPHGPAAPAPTLVSESTGKMLAQMRAVLDREAARLGADGLEGKAAVDLVSLIARTLEKIDQMERLIADDQARTAARTLSPDEREQLRQTVRQLILAAAERLAAERQAEAVEEGADGAGADGAVAAGVVGEVSDPVSGQSLG